MILNNKPLYKRLLKTKFLNSRILAPNQYSVFKA